MANILNFRTGVRLSADGKWIHCAQCSGAYWGAFRPTDFVQGKLTAHLAKKHAAEAGADAPADAQLRARVGTPQVIAVPQVKPRRAPKAPKKQDGDVVIVREVGPATAALV